MKRPIDWREDRSAVREKVAESARCVLPIVLIVVLLCLAAAPMKPDLLLSFLIGGVMLVVGMGLFSLGAEQSMTPIGTKIGTALTRTKNLPLILGVSFALGFAITVAEPDLQVLAETVPHISSTVLLLTVGVGVGLFMAVCMLRIVTGANLRWLLIGCYALIFLLAAFSDPDFLGIAFDSGGVTTGPMTVPFILAMGLGVSNIRSDRRAEADSFGLVALCSVGPILAVLILGFFYQGSDAVADLSSASFGSSTAIGGAFLASVPLYLREMAISMLPIVAIFFLFQVTLLRLPGRSLAKILIGILYTYVGLVLFLTGVNVGFSPLGAELGAELAVHGWLLVPLAMVLGWFIISAEPAVGVLEKQIESVSAGAIPGKVIQRSLSVAIALAMGLSMLRVLTGISILWFLVPGYGIALALSFFVPDIYTAIAFDSGGVASGPMTATFMLQFVMGASSALGGNILRDAFGVVALVAMMPLLSIQAVGFVYERRAKRTAAAPERLEILTDLCEGLGLPLTVTLHGRGTAVQSMLDLLGIESNERRVVLTIADAGKTAALIAAQKRRLHIGVPGHGIVIAVPIKSVGGGNTVAYLNGGRSPKYTPDLSCAYELIIAIANEGGTDAVMNAARAAGARGGTVLHGKGTGAKGAPKFYNISIAAEKEVILIVSAAGQKAEIMRSILRKAGPDSDAGAIVFSLPASAVAGFGLLEEN